MHYKKLILVNAFEDFYLLIWKNLEKIKKDMFFAAQESVEDKNEKVASLQSEICILIKEQDINIANSSGKFASNLFQEIVYIMVSLADELFLNFEWDGKAYWRAHSLEYKFFNTNCAGQKLLLNLDALIRNKNNVINKEIALVYLYAISLGFKGRLRYEKNCDEFIKILKDDLYYLIYNERSDFYQSDEKLFAQTESNILIENFEIKTTRFYNIKNAILITFGLYLIASYLVVYINTKDTWHLVKEFEKGRA